MSKTLHTPALSQAEIDQRSRESRLRLEYVEALLVPGIRRTRWRASRRLYLLLKAPIQRHAELTSTDRQLDGLN